MTGTRFDSIAIRSLLPFVSHEPFVESDFEKEEGHHLPDWGKKLMYKSMTLERHWVSIP